MLNVIEIDDKNENFLKKIQFSENGDINFYYFTESILHSIREKKGEFFIDGTSKNFRIRKY